MCGESGRRHGAMNPLRRCRPWPSGSPLLHGAVPRLACFLASCTLLCPGHCVAPGPALPHSACQIVWQAFGSGELHALADALCTSLCRAAPLPTSARRPPRRRLRLRHLNPLHRLHLNRHPRARPTPHPRRRVRHPQNRALRCPLLHAPPHPFLRGPLHPLQSPGPLRPRRRPRLLCSA